ncbi:type-F conjugative transfer system secretin TraK [Novosphingobium sp. SG707]|uniref:type-F conjugative transfer system secretin TraK n=1 Tax=Novosphingobium sp. SG707 TaxID=2586996 RepID=UPI0014479CEC|nr:type-F conjugative transfer system secretin TraK [Novosphingobium sp. SG707]NKJ02393.1 conjugal transfer pilus assembly protein TraK [Novosphingobium sp. SG707]
MPKPIKPGTPSHAILSAIALLMAMPAGAQTIRALPDQTSRIRLSNHDINHVVCEGGDIEDVKFSQEKGLAVEKGGSDAWIKFLVRQIDDAGQVTRFYVTQPSEFFITCNGATYPLYAEPADIPAQTVALAPGARQRAKANSDLLAPLADEDRAVSITMAILGNRIPASFSEIAPSEAAIRLSGVPAVTIAEHRRLAIEGSGLSASEYWVRASAPITLEERTFIDPALGEHIFAVSFDRGRLAAGESARLIVIRREAAQ